MTLTIDVMVDKSIGVTCVERGKENAIGARILATDVASKQKVMMAIELLKSLLR
jgi:hypothetical protein